MGQKSFTQAFTVGTTAVTVLPLRAEREISAIFNTAGTLYVKWGLGVSDTFFTERLGANEMTRIDSYSGAVSVVRGSGSSTVLVTEVW